MAEAGRPASVLVPARCPRARAALEGEGHARCAESPGRGAPARCPRSGAESAGSGGPRLSGAGCALAQAPAAGRRGRFAQGDFEPRDASRATAAPRGAARGARGAGSLTPSPALLRRPLRRGLSRSLSAGSAAAPRAAHAAAPARPAQPRRRSIPWGCAAATTAAAAN